MLLPVAAAVLLSTWVTTLQAQEQEQSAVTCVAGESKAWRCSRDGSAPEAAPLPELKTYNASAASPGGADVFSIPDPADDPARSMAPIDALMPLPSTAAPAARTPDLFTLKIASVSEVNEIPDFVESFGLDPMLVRFMPVAEGENTRQLILWGSFGSPLQATRAIVAMPNAVQAMRPQIAEVAALNAPLTSYRSLTADQPQVVTLAADSAGAPAAETVDLSLARPEPVAADQVGVTPAVALAAGAVPVPEEAQETDQDLDRQLGQKMDQ